jgi:nicotinamide-nucleotide amidase
MSLRCEILSTGDEVLTGQLVDTNAAFLADSLGALGFEVWRHTTVGDDRESLGSILREMGARADVVLVTGGLGPTVDDLTTEVAAEVLGCGLALDEPALLQMQGFWAKRGLTMPENNRKQAMLPERATVLVNPIGTAPGFMARIDRATCFFMPGVPREMKKMFADQVVPRLQGLRSEPTVFDVRLLRSFGLTESAADQLLGDLPAQYPDVKLGFRAHFPEIQVKATGKGPSGDSVRARLDAFTAEIKARLGAHLFSEGPAMEEIVGGLLVREGATLAVAENGTGGLVAELLTRASDGGETFRHGVVLCSNAAVMDVLGVPAAVLEEHAPDSDGLARAMAEAVRVRASATHGLAVTSISMPAGQTTGRPVGRVHVAVATPSGTHARRLSWPGQREQIRVLAAMSALDLLRRALLGLPIETHELTRR